MRPRNNGGGGGNEQKHGGAESGQVLSFPRSDISDENVEEVVGATLRKLAAGAPSSFSQIRELDFSQNKLGDRGILYLLEKLVKYCENLRIVKLFKNQINDEGCRAIGKFFRFCPQIAEMHLSHNEITERGLKSLINGCMEYRLEGMKPLWLRVEMNQIYHPEGLEKFFRKENLPVACGAGGKDDPELARVKDPVIQLPHFYKQKAVEQKGRITNMEVVGGTRTPSPPGRGPEKKQAPPVLRSFAARVAESRGNVRGSDHDGARFFGGGTSTAHAGARKAYRDQGKPSTRPRSRSRSPLPRGKGAGAAPSTSPWAEEVWSSEEEAVPLPTAAPSSIYVAGMPSKAVKPSSSPGAAGVLGKTGRLGAAALKALVGVSAEEAARPKPKVKPTKRPTVAPMMSPVGTKPDQEKSFDDKSMIALDEEDLRDVEILASPLKGALSDAARLAMEQILNLYQSVSSKPCEKEGEGQGARDGEEEGSASGSFSHHSATAAEKNEYEEANQEDVGPFCDDGYGCADEGWEEQHLIPGTTMQESAERSGPLGSTSGEAAAGAGQLDAAMQVKRYTSYTAGVLDIRYSTDRIKKVFDDGQALSKLIEQLQSGEVHPMESPFLRLQVWRVNGRLISCNNRRLYCLKQYDKKRREDGEVDPLQICIDLIDLAGLGGGQFTSSETAAATARKRSRDALLHLSPLSPCKAGRPRKSWC